MSRWLEAARQARLASDKSDLTDKTHAAGVPMRQGSKPMEVKSVKSVLSAGGIVGQAPDLPNKASHPDLAEYLAFLRSHGPCTYGAAAVALGWGAARAWQAEAELRAVGVTGLPDATDLTQQEPQIHCEGDYNYLEMPATFSKKSAKMRFDIAFLAEPFMGSYN